jgi:hypothetical protein
VSLSDEQFREQLVDYLYEELEGAQLEAFEAALALPARRAELEALRETLRAARSGLAALAEEPPTGARASILAAEQASREPARVVRGPWFRKLHAGVVLPALAAAAALAFAVLAPRRDHVPGQNYEVEARPRARERRNEAPAEPFPGSPSALPEAPREQARPGEPPKDQPPSADEAEQSASGSAPAQSERKREAPARARRPAGEGVAGRSGGGYAQPPPAAWDDLSDRGGVGALREVAPRAEQARASRAADTESAASTPPAAAPAKKGDPASIVRTRDRGRASTSAAPAAEQAAPQSPQAAPELDARNNPDALVERARAHAEARRWADAAIAYRELLQRFPRDPRAAAWRSELGRVARELSAVPLVP